MRNASYDLGQMTLAKNTSTWDNHRITLTLQWGYLVPEQNMYKRQNMSKYYFGRNDLLARQVGKSSPFEFFT